jgi:predicted ATPase/class 3 adenylate cyclase
MTTEGARPAARGRAASSLPVGTVTFLLSDIESSTRLWEQHPEAMRQTCARHDELIEALVARHAGVVVRPRGEGDSRFAVFARASDAVAAACAVQRAFRAEPWPLPDLRDGDYYGSAVNRCARLRAVAHGGQTLLSGVAASLTRERMPAGAALHGLGAHQLRDVPDPEQIYQLVHPELPARFPPLRTLNALPHNLPVQLTSFVGREREVADARRELLRKAVRLLTLSGPAGTGKTRLALQVAEDALAEFANGIFFVALARLDEPNLLASTIGEAIDVREVPGQPLLHTLEDALQAQEVLLLLDNFEHVMAQAPHVGELLAACPSLKVLVTSREVLHLSSERVLEVPPLAVPDFRRPLSVEQLTDYDAVRLFVERAQAAQPSFSLTDDNAPAVAEICGRLDGLPLAIELAAARVKLLPPQALLERLKLEYDHRQSILTGIVRDRPVRHQTLHSAIGWSYGLLNPSEQRLFAQLAVFSGGFTLDAAEAACAPPPPFPPDAGTRGRGDAGTPPPPSRTALLPWPSPRGRGDASGAPSAEAGAFSASPRPRVPASGVVGGEAVLEGVASLMDKSLLRQEDELVREPRFRMLETIREYALEQLRAAGELETMQSRLADVLVALAERAEPELTGPEQVTWLDRLEREHDNLRAALQWCAESGALELSLRLGGALWRFWSTRGYLGEGLRWLEAALAQAAPSTPVLARALNGAANLAREQGDYERARRLHEQSLAIAREQGDGRGTAEALNNLGLIALYQGQHGAAQQHCEEGLALFRQIGDQGGVAAALNNLGNLARERGDSDRASALHRESLTLRRGLGDRRGIALSLNNLANVVLNQGDYWRAAALHEESLALRRELGDRAGVATSLNNLANVARARGDYRAARAHYEESLALRRELGDTRRVAAALNNLGILERDHGDRERAAALLRESLALRRELGDRQGMHAALDNLRTLALKHADLAARAYHEESLALRRELGDRAGVVAALSKLGNIAHAQGDYQAAQAYYEESLALRHDMGDRRGAAATLNQLGSLALLQGSPQRAVTLLRQCLAIYQERGDRRGAATALKNLGSVCDAEGDHRAARPYYEESLTLFEELGDRRNAAECRERVEA